MGENTSTEKCNGKNNIKIIISPAKTMVENDDILEGKRLPVFMDETLEIVRYLKSLSYEELKTLWNCSDKLAKINFERLENMEPTKAVTPAIFSYEGIQYQYMAPSVLTFDQIDYIDQHLRILSGFYGVVRPLDKVTSYRLEMQAKAMVSGASDLYEFWGDKIYREVSGDGLDGPAVILNLASKEYSKTIEKYLKPEDTMVTCRFCEEVKGKLVQKATFAKMARGEMVRYMAEHNVSDLEEIKSFDRMGYSFVAEKSKDNLYTFVK